MVLTRNRVALGITGWWLLVLLFRVGLPAPGIVVNIVSFSFLILVPGGLTVSLLPLRGLAPWGKLAVSVGFSVLELIVVALIGNTLLPRLGVARPLSSPYLAAELTLMLAVLLYFSWRESRAWRLSVASGVAALVPSARDARIATLPVVFVALSIFGANSLNNGGHNYFTVALLCLIAGYGAFVAIVSKRLSENTIASVLFFTALSLLLMTSLRGWSITGHDIQLEYRVFQLTQGSGVWQIQHFRDPYNACLSITILPTVLSSFLRSQDVYIYKFYFQVIFALCPVIVYLIARRWSTKFIAFLAAFYFFAFPTFYIDMPFLNRQEIALLFYAIALYTVFETTLDLRLRRGLFIVMSLGVVLAHSSTTYTLLLVFGLAAVLTPLVAWYTRHSSPEHPATTESVVSGVSVRTSEKRSITIGMLAVLCIATIMWTVVLTGTGSNALGVMRQSIASVANGLSLGGRSSDATKLLGLASLSPSQTLEAYVKSVVLPARQTTMADTLYSASTYESQVGPAYLAAKLPMSRVGLTLVRLGIPVAGLDRIVISLLSKGVELMILIGVAFSVFSRFRCRRVGSEFLAIAVASLVFVGLSIVVPVLSVEYGLLRAVQQSLIVLGLFAVIGSLVVTELLKAVYGRVSVAVLPRKRAKSRDLRFLSRGFESKSNRTVAVVLSVLFFVYATSLVTQLIGGHYPLMFLNNAGSYYDRLYVHDGEVAAADWLGKSVVPSTASPGLGEVQGDGSNLTRIRNLSPLEIEGSANGIHPGLVRRDSYVYLGYENVHYLQSSMFFQGNSVMYKYPMSFLDENKDLIFNDGDARVYR